MYVKNVFLAIILTPDKLANQSRTLNTWIIA